MFCRRKASNFRTVALTVLTWCACSSSSPVFGPVFVYQRPIDAMVDVTNELGVAVLQDHVGTRSNFAFSPYGVASVLVLLYEGARGESARQIHDTLHFPWDRDVTRIGFRDVHRHLRTYFSHEGYLSGITLSKNHTSLLPEYQRVLRFYGYDVSRPQASTTRRPEDKTSGPGVTTPDGILLVITNETSSAEEEMATQVTTIEEALKESTTAVEDTDETTTTDIPTVSELSEGEETTSDKEATTELPAGTEGTTTEQEESTMQEVTEIVMTPMGAEIKDRIKVTDEDMSTMTTSQYEDVDGSTTTETTEEIKETEDKETIPEVNSTTMIEEETTQKLEETTQKIEESTQKIDETTEKIEEQMGETTQDLSETTAKENEKTVQETKATTPAIKEIDEEIKETTNISNELIVSTETAGMNLSIDEIEIIPEIEMPFDTMSEDQISTMLEEPTTTHLTDLPETTEVSETTSSTESPSEETSELPATSQLASEETSIPSPEKTKTPSSEETKKPSPEESSVTSEGSMEPSKESKEPSPEELIETNELPETVTETTEETDKETTMTAVEENTTFDEITTSAEISPLVTAEMEETTSTEYTTPEEEEVTTTDSASAIGLDDNKTTSKIFSMKTVMDTNRDNSTTRGSRNRRRRALRDSSGVDYPDMSLQLQNGMYGSSVARNVDVLHSRLPRAPFLVDGVLEESVPVMKYTSVFPFAFVPRLHAHALEFPLDDERYKLLLILPAERRGLRQLIHDLGSCPLREVFRALTPTRVHAVIPSFMVEGFVILTSTLQQMGIWDVFDPRRSNLSGMSGDPELFVRNIEQSITVVIRNYVEIVDIQTRTMAARSAPELFLATHPFLYFVVDTETRVSLMAGKIVDPLNSRIY